MLADKASYFTIKDFLVAKVQGKEEGWFCGLDGYDFN